MLAELLLDKFVIVCPDCKSVAFWYMQPTAMAVTVGQKIDLNNILGAIWHERNVPCCFYCTLAFGPADFKRDRIRPYEAFLAENPNANLPAQTESRPPPVEGVHTPPPPTKPLNFPSSPAGVLASVWGHFRDQLKKQTE